MATVNDVKERPVIMQAHSVRAILAGCKTQTRRVAGTRRGFNMDKKCRYGVAGDLLWVRESWCHKANDGGFVYNAEGTLDSSCVHYRADGADVIAVDGDGFQRYTKQGHAASPWSSPLRMPRWASRITLEITDLRIMRLQDISYNDAIAEGYRSVGEFAVGWDETNGHRTGCEWALNPWVWAVSFRRIKP